MTMTLPDLKAKLRTVQALLRTEGRMDEFEAIEEIYKILETEIMTKTHKHEGNQIKETFKGLPLYGLYLATTFADHVEAKVVYYDG